MESSMPGQKSVMGLRGKRNGLSAGSGVCLPEGHLSFILFNACHNTFLITLPIK